MVYHGLADGITTFNVVFLLVEEIVVPCKLDTPRLERNQSAPVNSTIERLIPNVIRKRNLVVGAHIQGLDIVGVI